MRAKVSLFLKLAIAIWLVVIYVLFTHQPPLTLPSKKSHELENQISQLEGELSQQSNYYSLLLEKLRSIKRLQDNQASEDKEKKEDDLIDQVPGSQVLPVLLLACNREQAVQRSLDLLLKYRPDKDIFPIIVSQDCSHHRTREVIESYGDKVTLIQQPDQGAIEVPIKEKKFKGYFNIARHYKWALDQVFHTFKHQAVIIVEDDLDIAADFFEYFQALYPIMKEDSTIWCVSAWNDNGKANLVDTSQNGSSLLYRTDFFPGLGWMMSQDLWKELGPKWPKSYWDDWVRNPDQRLERSCIRPEVSRTRTFGKKGVSNGLFFDKHLKFIQLNENYIPFLKMDMTYLLKEKYDPAFEHQVQESQVVTVADVKSARLPQGVSYRLVYHTKEIFKKIVKELGLMDDFKAGVPRTAYKGVISFFYGGRRIFLSPNNNWKGYDPTWS